MNNMTGSFPMIAKTMANLEDVLAQELKELGAEQIEQGIRMVSFYGDKSLLYKTNLWCRTAMRIIVPVYHFTAASIDEFYDKLREFEWDSIMSVEDSFSIDPVVFSSTFTHSQYITYKVKDAICDFFQEKCGERPSVSLSNPKIRFNMHIAEKECTLSLDSSGDSLHKRGYRISQNDAPLNEVLAAGMVLKTGWKGETPFVDPMCGSGTLLIEAAMIALNIPPGIYRGHFAFERWNNFDPELFSELYNDDDRATDFTFKLYGSDIDAKSVSISRKNIKNAGLTPYIELEMRDVRDIQEAPASKGILMVNPPYGERMRMNDIEALYGALGERLKHVFIGWDAYVLSYDKKAFNAIGLKYEERIELLNGSLPCEMRKFSIFSGKRDEFKKSDEFKEKKSFKDEKDAQRSSASSSNNNFRKANEFKSKIGFGRKESGEGRRDFKPRGNDFRRDDRFKSREGFARKEGGEEGRRDFKPRGNDFRRDDRFKSRDGFARKEGGEGRRDFKPRGNDFRRDDRFKSRDGFARKDGGEGRRDFKPRGNDFRRDDRFKSREGFARKEGGEERRDFKPRGNDFRRDDRFKSREGFARKEGGEGRRDFKPRGNDFRKNRNNER